jgi:hypothetical protein
MNHYIVCDDRANQSRIHVKICQDRCEKSETCKAFQNYIKSHPPVETVVQGVETVKMNMPQGAVASPTTA